MARGEPNENIGELSDEWPDDHRVSDITQHPFTNDLGHVWITFCVTICMIYVFMKWSMDNRWFNYISGREMVTFINIFATVPIYFMTCVQDMSSHRITHNSIGHIPFVLGNPSRDGFPTLPVINRKTIFTFYIRMKLDVLLPSLQ